MNVRFRPVALVLAAAALLFNLGVSAGERPRIDEIRQLRESGRIMAAEEIIARSRSVQPGQVVGLELERDDGRWVYEVKLIDTGNRLHKLELDAATGDVLEREEK
ncbi:MAG: PepSY domain-containing protein [Thauera sp.]|jgi:uncharacterized membrane protein YkoI